MVDGLTPGLNYSRHVQFQTRVETGEVGFVVFYFFGVLTDLSSGVVLTNMIFLWNITLPFSNYDASIIIPCFSVCYIRTKRWFITRYDRIIGQSGNSKPIQSVIEMKLLLFLIIFVDVRSVRNKTKLYRCLTLPNYC